MRVFLIYIHARKASFLPKEAFFGPFTLLAPFRSKKRKMYLAYFQSVTKKMHFFLNFFAKIFGQFKKKQYLCIRFRPKI